MYIVEHELPFNLKPSYMERFYKMSHYLNVSNNYVGKRMPLSTSYIEEILKFNTHEVYRRFIRELINNNVVMEIKNIVYVNPLYARHVNFVWNKYTFDMFEPSIIELMHEFEYLKLKSKWYEAHHLISLENYSDLVKDVSGIYRLYKDNEIVYIGKSKCIKSRLWSHVRERDIDSFDFTILDNESDKNIYEVYYIDRLKPKLNKDCMEKSTSSVELQDLIFSEIIKV